MSCHRIRGDAGGERARCDTTDGDLVSPLRLAPHSHATIGASEYRAVASLMALLDVDPLSVPTPQLAHTLAAFSHHEQRSLSCTFVDILRTFQEATVNCATDRSDQGEDHRICHLIAHVIHAVR